VEALEAPQLSLAEATQNLDMMEDSQSTTNPRESSEVGITETGAIRYSVRYFCLIKQFYLHSHIHIHILLILIFILFIIGSML
jgi:hypothetical protein